jgi:hypothetical protein
MGYDASVLVIFGISLSENQFQALFQEFHSEMFANLGTGKDPDGNSWSECFENIEDEKEEIIYSWFSELDNISGTKYYLTSVNNRDTCQGYFLVLHMHTHGVQCYSDDPKELVIPAIDEIQTFLNFVKPHLDKHGIEMNYKAITVVEGG